MPHPFSVQHRRRQTGFSLVELLVVVFIIGLLVALTIKMIGKVRRAAYGSATSAQLVAISTAIQSYYNDFKAYPGPIANNQLGAAWDTGTSGNSVPKGPYIYAGGQYLSLKQLNSAAYPSLNNPNFNNQIQHITGAQNLVLGLVGGLRFITPDALGRGTYSFEYHPEDIFPDGHTPGPTGPRSLSAANPRKQNSYIQVNPGELYLPYADPRNNGNVNGFTDWASRYMSDAALPVFLDKFPDPMPIIYIRANVGGKGIVGVRHGGVFVDDNGSPLVDTANSAYSSTPIAVVPQYDLCQVLDYTSNSSIHGTGGPIGSNKSDPTTAIQGLQGLGPQLGQSGCAILQTTTSGTNIKGQPANAGYNAIAYFADPNTLAQTANNLSTNISNTHGAAARQADGFLLIAAGQDRIYGTTDDSVYPGSLLVSN